ncbi:MAG TPA: hypothetical protein GX524_07965 [Firmicutes bacterium]|jgi:hypothetical protein|nr:hypothetical protein [Bacillota bacterium]
MIFEGRASIGVAMVVFAVVFAWKVYSARQGRLPKIRKLPALDAIDEAIGRATELGKPVHQALSYQSITSSAANPMLLSAISVSRYVARKAAEMGTDLIVTVGAAETYSVAEEVVRTSYLEAGKPDAYDASIVRFLSPAQFAYTTATIGIMSREKVAANIMIGYFAAESLILAESGHSLGAIQIAGTSVMPQIPFFVVACDYCLIGEEVYAVSAYLEKDPETLGTISGQDVAKAIAGVLIFLGSLGVTFGSRMLVDLLGK